MENKLIIGDTFDILKTIQSDSIDCIFLDIKNVLHPFDIQTHHYPKELLLLINRWKEDMNIFYVWLKGQVYEMKRILKNTGSFYFYGRNYYGKYNLNHYIKTVILDKIFMMKNFRGELLLKNNTGIQMINEKRNFISKFDTVYFYSKTEDYIFNNTGEKIETIFDNETLKINQSRNINQLFLSFAEQIIKVSTDIDNIILEPFITNMPRLLNVTNKLDRNWIGIGLTEEVSEIIREYEIENLKIIEHKYNYDELRYKNAFLFENWIIQKFCGIPNKKQHNDKGIDGKTIDNIPIQVKRQDNIGRNVIDNFKSAMARYDKKLFDENVLKNKIAGYIIAFSFGQGAIEEVKRLSKEEKINIQLVNVKEIVKIK
jgi:hypothetical protein